MPEILVGKPRHHQNFERKSTCCAKEWLPQHVGICATPPQTSLLQGLQNMSGPPLTARRNLRQAPKQFLLKTFDQRAKNLSVMLDCSDIGFGV